MTNFTRTVWPYELVDDECGWLLTLACKLTGPSSLRAISEKREVTPFLTTVTTRHGEAARGFDLHRYSQASGESVKLTSVGLGVELSLWSTHWPGHSDTGRGVTLSVSGPEARVSKVAAAMERIEREEGRCVDGGRLGSCSKLRCAQCGVMVRSGSGVYRCDCAHTAGTEGELPLRGDCDTSYDATWWCGGHGVDPVLPPPWKDKRVAPKPPPAPPPLRRVRASDIQQQSASDFGVTVPESPLQTREEFLRDLRASEDIKRRFDAATALQSFEGDEVLRALLAACREPDLTSIAWTSIRIVLALPYAWHTSPLGLLEGMLSGRPTRVRAHALDWLTTLVEKRIAGDPAAEFTTAVELPEGSALFRIWQRDPTATIDLLTPHERWWVTLMRLGRAETDEEISVAAREPGALPVRG